jgi:hypothetical protein
LVRAVLVVLLILVVLVAVALLLLLLLLRWTPLPTARSSFGIRVLVITRLPYQLSTRPLAG